MLLVHMRYGDKVIVTAPTGEQLVVDLRREKGQFRLGFQGPRSMQVQRIKRKDIEQTPDTDEAA